MLLVQADRRLRSIFLFVKQTEELPVILPIPAGVVYVHEAFALDLARNFIERRKNFG